MESFEIITIIKNIKIKGVHIIPLTMTLTVSPWAIFAFKIQIKNKQGRTYIY